MKVLNIHVPNVNIRPILNLSVDIPPLDFWKLIYLRSLLMQLQEAKHSVQEDRMKYLQGLIDSLVL